MWALVEDSEIVKIIKRPQGITIDNTRHSRKIFELWSKEELEDKNIYEIVFDYSNKKDSEYYFNTEQSFNYADGVVTASYGIATPKSLEDLTWTQEDSDNGLLPEDKSIGDFKAHGLKSIKKINIKDQASSILSRTDWHIIKETDVEDYSIPSSIKTYRADVRTKSNEMETAIDNASDVDALQALYIYTEQDDGSVSRPLGEFPILEE